MEEFFRALLSRAVQGMNDRALARERMSFAGAKALISRMFMSARLKIVP